MPFVDHGDHVWGDVGYSGTTLVPFIYEADADLNVLSTTKLSAMPTTKKIIEGMNGNLYFLGYTWNRSTDVYRPAVMAFDKARRTVVSTTQYTNTNGSGVGIISDAILDQSGTHLVAVISDATGPATGYGTYGVLNVVALPLDGSAPSSALSIRLLLLGVRQRDDGPGLEREHARRAATAGTPFASSPRTRTARESRR